jgi:hypothetical protein
MENQPQNLSVSDLIMLQGIVQVACERGCFRADEMSQIGQCYDRLSAWLAQMTAPAETETPNEETKGE